MPPPRRKYAGPNRRKGNESIYGLGGSVAAREFVFVRGQKVYSKKDRRKGNARKIEG